MLTLATIKDSPSFGSVATESAKFDARMRNTPIDDYPQMGFNLCQCMIQNGNSSSWAGSRRVGERFG